jgi:hypothetical protein
VRLDGAHVAGRRVGSAPASGFDAVVNAMGDFVCSSHTCSKGILEAGRTGLSSSGGSCVTWLFASTLPDISGPLELMATSTPPSLSMRT